jgi:hypothetical protein
MTQRERILALREQECESAGSIRALNAIMRDYTEVLLAIQKIRFDLGLDEYKRTMPIGTRARSARPCKIE